MNKNNTNGIVNVYKEAGFTSFDVVAKLRGIFGQRKIGHTGTLDPDATGVLPIVLGNATKLVDMMTDKKKEYVASLVLGKTTDTQDISGTVLTTHDVECSEEEVRTAILSFKGEISQVPPMYSALKVDGKRLYELAREGKEVERKARKVTIYDLEIISINLPEITMRVECSKGTYIRTLCHDLGQKLGCGGVMTKLERTASGQFKKENAYTLSQLQSYKDEGELDKVVLKVDVLFKEYAATKLSGEALRLALNGNILNAKELKTAVFEEGNYDMLRLYDDTGVFFALYMLSDNKKQYKPYKMFLNE